MYFNSYHNADVERVLNCLSHMIIVILNPILYYYCGVLSKYISPRGIYYNDSISRVDI